MKKKRKYKSPQIIVMDYEMEESCLDEGSIHATIPTTTIEEETEGTSKRIIPLVNLDSNDDW